VHRAVAAVGGGSVLPVVQRAHRVAGDERSEPPVASRRCRCWATGACWCPGCALGRCLDVPGGSMPPWFWVLRALRALGVGSGPDCAMRRILAACSQPPWALIGAGILPALMPADPARNGLF